MNKKDFAETDKTGNYHSAHKGKGNNIHKEKTT